MNDLINDNYIDGIYDNLQREQQRITNELKTNDIGIKQKYNQKQFNIINTLLSNLLKLRNLKKEMRTKLDD